MGEKCQPTSTSTGSFESSGTVRLGYDSDGKVISEIYFTSAKHHTIEHRGKKYAVFVSRDTRPSHTDTDKDRRLFDAKLVKLEDDGVKLETVRELGDPMLRDLALSAIKSVGVDVSVTISGDKLHHQSAVVPAQSHTK